MGSWVMTFLGAIGLLGIALVQGAEHPQTTLWPLMAAGSVCLTVYSLVKILKGLK